MLRTRTAAAFVAIRTSSPLFAEKQNINGVSMLRNTTRFLLKTYQK